MELENLKEVREGVELFNAGLPHFPRNFSRDSIISAILMDDFNMLKNQLLFSSRFQGKGKDPTTGEEEGKIFHEFPGYDLNGLKTTYNACDTTALFLIGHKVYFDLTKDSEFIAKQKDFLNLAVDYLIRHIKNGLFLEDPSFSDAKRYALKVTYWKDSALMSRKNGDPSYPISYLLVNAQVICGLRSAFELLGNNKYLELAEDMVNKLSNYFFDNEKGFCIAEDSMGKIFASSSDFLHMLFYLEKGDLEQRHLNKILENSKSLETHLGYRTLSSDEESLISDDYHSKTVWPFEQAIIWGGANKFGLDSVKEVSKRVFDLIKNSSTEIVLHKDGIWIESGCNL